MSQEAKTPAQGEKKDGRSDKTRPTNPLQESPADPIQSTLMEAARQGMAAEVDFDHLPEPVPELDEGPRPGPVDEIQDVLLHATQAGAQAEVSLEELPEPLPDLDEGPRPAPVDEIQGAIFSAAREGLPTELDFEALPEPGRVATKKVVRFKSKSSPQPASLTPADMEAGVAPQPTVPVALSPARASLASDFWFLLLLFLSFRVLTLLLLRPGGFLRDWSDFDTYLGIAGLSDYSLFPFLDFWLEWPPLVPWLAVGAYKLSLLLPPWPDDPRFWFVTILGGAFVLFEIGNFVLIYRLARRLFDEAATVNRVLWFYAGLFPPVYAMLGFFDGTALFFILLALELLLSERRFASAVAVGFGFMVKVIPLLMLPVAMRRIWHQHRANNREAGVELGLYAVVFGLTVLLLLAPFLIGGPQWVKVSAQSMLGRSSWETVWAVAEGYFGFGQVGGDRLNPAETGFAVHAGWLPWELLTILFGGLYAFIISRRADYSRPRSVLALAGLTVSLFLLYTKGYSPQFLVYLLPFLVLLFPDWRGLVYALIFTGLNILEQPVYFVLLPQATWLLTFVVVARFLMLIVVAVEFALVIWPAEAALPRLAQAHRRALPVIGGLAVLALVVLVPLLLQAYLAGRLVDSPLGTFVGFMESQIKKTPRPPANAARPRLLVSDQTAYRQIYPYLHEDFEVKLVGGAGQYEAAPRITDFLQGLDTVWVLPVGEQQETLAGVMAEQGQPLASFDFDGLGKTSWYGLRANMPPFMPPARFNGGIELLAHRVEVRAGVVDVTLYWRARARQTQSFTVFTQLLDDKGQLVAGHDSIPANGQAPTNEWPVNAVQADSHRIELPANLLAGPYRLVAGLYLSQNPRARLPGINPDGGELPGQAIPLETVRLP